MLRAADQLAEDQRAGIGGPHDQEHAQRRSWRLAARMRAGPPAPAPASPDRARRPPARRDDRRRFWASTKQATAPTARTMNASQACCVISSSTATASADGHGGGHARLRSCIEPAACAPCGAIRAPRTMPISTVTSGKPGGAVEHERRSRSPPATGRTAARVIQSMFAADGAVAGRMLADARCSRHRFRIEGAEAALAGGEAFAAPSISSARPKSGHSVSTNSKLRIGRLPEQEVGQPLLAARCGSPDRAPAARW